MYYRSISIYMELSTHALQVSRLHQRGQEGEAKKASLRAATYSSWAFLGAVITAVVSVSLLVAGTSLLICFGIDWEKR